MKHLARQAWLLIFPVIYGIVSLLTLAEDVGVNIEIRRSFIENPWLRRATLPIVLSAGLLLTACGNASSEAEQSTTTPVATSSPTPSPSIPNPSTSETPTTKPNTDTPASKPTSPAPTSSSTETASPSAALSAEQIELLAPTIDDHNHLPVLTRIFYKNQTDKKQYEEGDYATYLSWPLYKEKDASGKLVPDEDTPVYDYNPYDPESRPSPDDTCEQIRQEFIYNQALLGAITNSPAEFYDEANELPLNHDKVNRLLAGMFVQPFNGSHAAEFYDKMVFNYKSMKNARPNPDLARLVCQSTKTKGNKATTIEIGGQKVQAVKKDIVLKLANSGTVYDASFALVSGEVGGESVSSWLVYSFDERS